MILLQTGLNAVVVTATELMVNTAHTYQWALTNCMTQVTTSFIGTNISLFPCRYDKFNLWLHPGATLSTSATTTGMHITGLTSGYYDYVITEGTLNKELERGKMLYYLPEVTVALPDDLKKYEYL